MGFPRQEYWSGLPFPSPGDLPNPGIKPMSLMSPTLASGFFNRQRHLGSRCTSTRVLKHGGWRQKVRAERKVGKAQAVTAAFENGWSMDPEIEETLVGGEGGDTDPSREPAKASQLCQPQSELCPWNAPGKNSGVDSHSLLSWRIARH